MIISIGAVLAMFAMTVFMFVEGSLADQKIKAPQAGPEPIFKSVQQMEAVEHYTLEPRSLEAWGHTKACVHCAMRRRGAQSRLADETWSRIVRTMDGGEEMRRAFGPVRRPEGLTTPHRSRENVVI